MDSELEAFTIEYGVDFDTARNMIAAQDALVHFAEEARNHAGYAGFKVVNDPPVVRGVLAVTHPEAFAVPDSLRIEIIRARISESGMDEFNATVVSVLRSTLTPQVEAVTYDPFEDIFLVWAAKGALSQTDQNGIREFMRSHSPDLFESATVTFREVEEASFGYGGLLESKAGNGRCTSAFGVARVANGVVVGGYLTAGHCRAIGGAGWSVVHPTGNKPVTAYRNLSVSTWGYHDRVVFEAAGSSFWVKIASPNIVVDMSATPGHIFLGTFYCHYGANSNDQNCGTIQEVNFPLSDSGYTVLTSRSSALCWGGDSGGPVWRPITPTRAPSGLISGYNSSSQCLYVALDDQLSGTPWSLQ